MKYIKDFLNFKEAKVYKIAIIILSIIVVMLQTSQAITSKKIRILTERIHDLKEENSKLQISNQSLDIPGISSLVDSQKDVENNIIAEELISKFIDKYSEIAEENDKKYNPNIKEGNKHLVYETMELTMTDNQIKYTLKSIEAKEFGIEIVESTLIDKAFYKIYLIEGNIGS